MNLTHIPRAEKLTIAARIQANLRDRKKKGPAEPGLDAFISELADLTDALETHVTGNLLADAAHQSRLARSEAADVDVDTWLRHIEGFLNVEAHRRSGAATGLARGLYEAACPDGLAHINDRIVDENAHCRSTLTVLKAPEHAKALATIALPSDWIARFEAALDASDAAIADVTKARDDKSTHIDKGRDAELAWIDLMVRLRRYVGSRAKRTDTDRLDEGKALLRPLLEALVKLRTDAATRATRRAGKPPAPLEAPASPAAPPAA